MTQTSQAAMAAFQQLVLTSNKQRHYFGAITLPEARAEGANPLCGDQLEVSLRLVHDQVQQARYQGEMSAITMAAAEQLCAAIEDRSKTDALSLLQDFLQSLREPTHSPALPAELSAFDVLRHYPNRLKTATLPAATLIAALQGESKKVSTER